jgi:hypothetical protein
MDPLERADRALAKAATRRDVVTPETAISPMDAETTQEIPRTVIAAVAAQADPPTTPLAVQQPAAPAPVGTQQGGPRPKPSPVTRPRPKPRPDPA